MRRSNAAVWFIVALASVPVGCHDDPPRAAPSASPKNPVPRLIDVARSAATALTAAPTGELRPLRLPPSASLASGESVPTSSLWTSCAEGFVPMTTPEADVMRIGTACGPVNGLSLLRRWMGNVDEAKLPSSATHSWDATRGDCFRLVAVADAAVEDLEIEVDPPKPRKGEEADEDERGLLANQNRRWVVLAEEGPFCAHRDGEFVARVSTHGGKGAYALSVWRGANMWTKPKSKRKP